MIELATVTHFLNKVGIKISGCVVKEELVRWYAGNFTERIVEYPLVFSHLPKTKAKILDVGCRYSLLPIQLASMGHQVYGIDLFDYRKRHPNFSFFKGDSLKPPFKKEFFDVVIAVSTVEHIGLFLRREEG